MISRRPVTMALSALLTSATGLPVGRGALPPGQDPPYYVLRLVDHSTSGAPLADDNEDASLVYQVDSISGPDPDISGSTGSEDQAEWMADKARQILLGRDPVTGLWLHALTVPGAKVIRRSLETEPGGTNDPADAIIHGVQRFRLDLTPA